MTAGIYYIVNKINDKKYVGSSINIEKRWREHKRLLRGGYHHNKHLQNAWNKYGEENFDFKIMAYTDPDKAVVIEDFILQNYFDRFEYNIAEKATAPVISGENNPSFGVSHKGENNPFYGKHHSEKTKRKMSELKMGESNPWYGKTGKNHPMYGRAGENSPNWIDIPDETILSMGLLREQGYSYQKIADIFGISHGTVWDRLNANPNMLDEVHKEALEARC